jgi:hypothetical protein
MDHQFDKDLHYITSGCPLGVAAALTQRHREGDMFGAFFFSSYNQKPSIIIIF